MSGLFFDAGELTNMFPFANILLNFTANKYLPDEKTFTTDTDFSICGIDLP